MTYNKNDPKNMICKLLLNNLYGKFGMSPHLNYYKLVDYTLIDKLPEDILVLSNNLGLSSYNLDRNQDVSNSKGYHLNISLPIAMAVTAYARMHMYQFKQSLGDFLLYSDTDSIFTSLPLPQDLVGKKLGQMKLEYSGSRAIFIAPKVYCVQLNDGSLVKKVKGLKEDLVNTLNYSDFENLLKVDSSKDLIQDKLFKLFENSTIHLKSVMYNLKTTENKRAIVYAGSRAIYTKPFVLNE